MAHPNKHIRDALDYAEQHGWRFEKARGHAHIYGSIYCSHGHNDCMMFIHSTPRNPENHGKRIRRTVQECPNHQEE